MTDELTPEILDLLDTGREILAKQRSEHQARKADETSKRQAQINEQIATLHDVVMSLLPAAVRPYCGLLCDDTELLTGWQYARLEVPGCAPITIAVECNRYYDNKINGFTQTFDPVKRDDFPLFEVTRYQLAFDDDAGLYSVIERSCRSGESHYGSNEIAIALASAAEWETKRVALEAEAARKTAELQAKRAAQQTQAAAAEQRATTEREALLDLLSDDPVLLSLLKVVIALKQERAGYAESIDHLHDALENQGEFYQRRIDEKHQEAVLALRNSRDEVERSQREADDLQAQLSRIKRQMQYA